MRIRTRALEPRWLLVISFFIAGIFLGMLALYLMLNLQSPALKKLHSQGGEYKYVNPLLAVDLEEGLQFVQQKALQLKLQGLLAAAKANHTIVDASLYFRDIEPGSWVNINGDGKFSPGKLLKLPIMIAYFKLAQTDPSVLNQRITYYGGQPRSSNLFPIAEKLQVGTSYAVSDLIHRMIVFSDDEAANLLFDAIDKNSLNEVFSDLGIDFKEEKEVLDFISLKAYTLFFRVLYNATYLNREYSEKALDLLVEADNSIGLNASLPKDIPTANRYGGRLIPNRIPAAFEVYDCGIIYYPSHPYFLCGIAQGNDLNKIKTFFKDVGDATYNEVDYEYKT